MAISIYNIKKWSKMLIGKSILHVNQNVGRVFSTSEIRGYYNDLTEKVTRLPRLLETDELPSVQTPSGANVDFSVSIFQYGLGAYDLYLVTGEYVYYKKFWQAVNWTLKNQQQSGAWDSFGWIYPDYPYGAMAQGEAVSLLMRAYKESLDPQYLNAATKAISFMVSPVEAGGCTVYKDDNILLLEYTNKAAVLNGWIFAWWGLYDYVLETKDPKINIILHKSLITLKNTLNSFSNSYWSLYDLSNHIASPFYHNLHISQMKAMYELTGMNIFREYEVLWKHKQNNIICKTRAFICKVWQKIKE